MLSGVLVCGALCEVCGEQRAVRGEGPIPLGGELGVELPELREERHAVAAKYMAQRERRYCARAAWHSPGRRAREERRVGACRRAAARGPWLRWATHSPRTTHSPL